MKVMRQECEALICVLKTFIHDPLVEWEKVKGKPSSTDTTNEKAVKIVKDIEDRLQGKYPKSKGLPLSVEGQVHALIKVWTSVCTL
jgi:serine/threonine-protein kinase ATR